MLYTDKMFILNSLVKAWMHFGTSVPHQMSFAIEERTLGSTGNMMLVCE